MEWVKSLGIALILFVTIRFFLLQTFVITSGSMENTLLVGDFLVANRAAFGARIPGTTRHLPGYSRPALGDVVVFDPHHDIDEKLVKRLVGLAGDTLGMVEGVLVRNGVPQVEPWARHGHPGEDGTSPDMQWQRAHLVETVDPASYWPTRDNWGPLVVPDGHYFLLGDNRDDSLDSRYWGPLETWRVEARAAFVYYSYDRTLFKPFPWVTAVRGDRIGELIR